MINLTLINRRIFIGTYPHSEVDMDRLRSGPKISAVLNLQTDADFSPDDLERKLALASDLLHQLITIGHRVYVHCTAGIGRAPAGVTGYLAWYEGMELEAAGEKVKSLRPLHGYHTRARRDA